ncbi:inner membrane protein YhjD [Nakamurella lactea]|uniref:inner membrane protein YhjD n=1 Tax=Nakamurella lactea TaxID=459515 RepID=UPI000420CDDE|nr:inner membrane protein YhjD [Nakamurella lactea]
MNEPGSGADDPIGLGGSYRDRMRRAEQGVLLGAVTDAANPADAAADESAVVKAKALAAKVTRKPWVDHLIKAAARFTDRLGNQFGAAITYFSFLAVVPVLMVAFAVAAFVLQGNQQALDDLKDQVNEQIPGGLMNGVIESALNSALGIGIVGLVIALYSGVGWMSNVRDAVHAQWRLRWEKTEAEKKEKFYVRYAKDLLTLIGLGIAMLLSLALTTAGGSAQSLVIDWLGLDEVGWLRPFFSVVPFLLAIVASTLMFGWFFRMMKIPEYSPSPATLLKGSVAAAVGFEVLKLAMTFLIPRLTTSPTFAVFGSIIVLLFFFNLVAKLVLFVAAWIGTAPGQVDPEVVLPEIPGPAVVVHDETGPTRTAGLLGIGALAGFLAGRRNRRNRG